MAMVTLYARFAEGSVTGVDGLLYSIRHGIVTVPQSCVPALEAVGFVQAPISEQAGLVPAVEALATDAAYAVGAVHFDGANSSLVNEALACTDSGDLSLAFWFKYDNTPNKTLWASDAEGAYANYQGPANISQGTSIYLSNGGSSFTALENDAPDSTPWHSFVASIKTDLGSGQKIAKCYLDDVNVSIGLSDGNASFIPQLNGKSFLVGDDSFGSGMVVDLADFWFAPGQSLLTGGDLLLETVRKFRDADGMPVDLGVDGSTPTGTAPAIFFHRAAGADAGTFADNLGTGGAFSIVGSITAADTSPSDSVDVGFANPMTAANDLIVGGADGAATRFAAPSSSGTWALQCIDGTMTWVAVV